MTSTVAAVWTVERELGLLLFLVCDVRLPEIIVRQRQARGRCDGAVQERNSLGNLPLGQSGAATLDAGVEAWKQFIRSAPQHDDASLLLLLGLPWQHVKP